MNECFSIKELATYLRCSTSFIRGLVRNNEIVSYRIGNRLFFRKEQVDLWIRKNEMKNMQDNNLETKIKPLKREVS